MTPELLSYAAAGLAFIAVVAVGFVFAGADKGKQIKRVRAIGDGGIRGRVTDASQARRTKMQDTMKGLRDREQAIRRKRVAGKSIEERIKQAGLTFPVSAFWIGSGVIGVLAFVGVMFAGFEYYIAGGVAFAAFLGVPRWALGMAIGMRQKKFIGQFADAIDVIVRGVKSGLPLGECLKVIARESSQPIAGEFQLVCDAIAMGVPVDQALNKMYMRTPVQEVNFFNIVLNIQQKAGGNLSEALGNLSTVLRSRKLLREKIKALSSEAKASAMIIGSLPIIVCVLVYLTTPAYIMVLFTTDIGHLILLGAGTLMGTGIFVMRQMINFDF
jgi:tight adherence protein B